MNLKQNNESSTEKLLPPCEEEFFLQPDCNHSMISNNSHHKMKKPWISQKTTFIVNIIMSLAIFFVEIIVGNLYGSISLVSDSFHVLSDAISMIIGFYALLKSSEDRTIESQQNSQYTYGFERFQIMGSLANGLLLLAFSFNIITESLIKFLHANPITEPKYVLIAGVVGLVANLISLILFHGIILRKI
uniref:Zinc/cadmium resistance protein (Trinotate prediction) n=1 Tax=Henneguya salminicola TaxID=69463 RepID=A0A6G3MEN4_HENSL